MKPLRTGVLTLALVVLGLATACGSNPDLASHEGLLALIPDEPERRDAIWIVDYAALRELPQPPDEASLSRDGDLTPLRDLSLRTREYIGVTGVSPLGSREALAFPEIEQNWQTGLAFSFDDVDIDIRAGFGPALVLGAAVGNFDAAAIDAHLRACEECTQPRRITRDRGTYYDWGDGLGAGDRLAPPVFDNLGRGGQYLFTDRYVLRAQDSETFESAFDARGTEDSLAGNATFVQLGRVLDSIEDNDGIELLATLMSDMHQGPALFGPLTDGDLIPERQRVVDAAFATDLLLPYRAYALAGGLRDGEPVTVLVLAHGSANAASENEHRLSDRLDSTLFWDQQPWDSIFQGWELETDGTTLIAILEGQPRWEGSTFGDPLLFHE